ncbi:hypothetical protein, partial [Pseudomonas salomonii]|uniref:hypothetical protein n=1 Tax=Pseudomonas salomonii TaxID=191391 RepID=UPI00210CE9D8
MYSTVLLRHELDKRCQRKLWRNQHRLQLCQRHRTIGHQGKNSLVTSSLTSRDIKNKADYDANTVSLGGGLFSQTSPDESEEQREAKRNLIVSLVTGLAATGASIDP